MTKRLFIFGLGYSGLEIARLAKAAGWSVAGTCTGDEKAERLRRDGIEAWRFDGTPAPPTTNTAPSVGSDPHSKPRNSVAGRNQKSAFLQTGGSFVDVCGGAPCVP